MAGRFLLDTNIIIAYLRGDDVVQEHFSQSSEIFLSVTVVGELYYGAEKSEQREKNSASITYLTTQLPVLLIDTETSKWYGIIKAKLQKKGKPIPENDIWIAAIALRYELVLVTRDSHFDEVEGIHLERW